MEDKVISPEKAEEAKLKARYPNLGSKPGGSDFLRKRLQKGVGVYPRLKPHPQTCLTLSFVTSFILLCSQSTLILVTTTWQRPKWRTSSCHRPRRRRRRSLEGTSQHLRTCLKERLRLWPANLLADGFMFFPFCYHSKQTPHHIFLLFTLLLIFHICMHSLRTSYK